MKRLQVEADIAADISCVSVKAAAESLSFVIESAELKGIGGPLDRFFYLAVPSQLLFNAVEISNALREDGHFFVELSSVYEQDEWSLSEQTKDADGSLVVVTIHNPGV